MNYFELFELPVTLQPDENLIKQKYYELSRRYHPDMHTRDTPGEQAEMLERAALVNQALKVLSNRQELLRYVLEQKGLLTADEKYELPEIFLMEMMEINEKMMELEFDPDEEAIAALYIQVKEMEQELYSRVQPLIAVFGEGAGEEEMMEKLKELYFRQKYLLKIQEKLGTFASP